MGQLEQFTGGYCLLRASILSKWIVTRVITPIFVGYMSPNPRGYKPTYNHLLSIYPEPLSGCCFFPFSQLSTKTKGFKLGSKEHLWRAGGWPCWARVDST